jgi:hypothetical protein
MELVGSLFLILALAVIVAVYIGKPFLLNTEQKPASSTKAIEHDREHQISSLLAERDRVLNALQELDFDYSLGKIPVDEYPQQRAALLKSGSDVLRALDEMTAATSAKEQAVEDRIEAAVAVHRADAARVCAGSQEAPQIDTQAAAVGMGGNGKGKDALEEIIAARKRQRRESAAGFCPRCGKPVQKSDKFCSKCGTTL